MELTIDRLFRVCTEVILPNEDKIVVRALSDAERKSKATLCLMASIRLEEAISDENSDAYTVHILPHKRADRQTLVDIAAAWERNNATRDSYKEIKDEFIPIPDEATDDERKDILRKREKSEEETNQKREAFIEARVEAAIKQAEKQADDDLRKSAIAKRKAIASLQESWDTDCYASVFYGAEKNGKRYFNSIEEVKALDTTVYYTLLEAQREVDSVSPYAIEKFRAGRKSERVVERDQEPQPDTQQ